MSETESHDLEQDIRGLADAHSLPGILATLAILHPSAIVTEAGPVHLFRHHLVSVKRAVERGNYHHRVSCSEHESGPLVYSYDTSNTGSNKQPGTRKKTHRGYKVMAGVRAKRRSSDKYEGWFTNSAGQQQHFTGT
jgi:hypothetical protein